MSGPRNLASIQRKTLSLASFEKVMVSPASIVQNRYDTIITSGLYVPVNVDRETLWSG